MIRINLNCGRDVEVNGFEFGHTYRGLLEGSPNERVNRNIFDSISYPLNWGSRKVLKILPSEDDFENGLKPAHYAVWLISNPIKTIYDRSKLVVIWFGKSPYGKTVEEVIQEGIESIEWNDNAQDFDY